MNPAPDTGDLCQCYPQSTPHQNLVILTTWAKTWPAQVPTCSECRRPYDLRTAYIAVVS
jgi:hypothetical protein